MGIKATKFNSCHDLTEGLANFWGLVYQPPGSCLAASCRPANMGLPSAWHRLGHQTSQPLPLVVRICQDNNAGELPAASTICAKTGASSAEPPSNGFLIVGPKVQSV